MAKIAKKFKIFDKIVIIGILLMSIAVLITSASDPTSPITLMIFILIFIVLPVIVAHLVLEYLFNKHPKKWLVICKILLQVFTMPLIYLLLRSIFMAFLPSSINTDTLALIFTIIYAGMIFIKSIISLQEIE